MPAGPLKVAHFAPFAPHMAGMYEAARDFVRCDRLAGRTSEFVDTGVTIGGKRQPPKVGAVDERKGFTLKTASPLDVEQFDLFVMHDGVEYTYLQRQTVPMVVVIHGRPLYARGTGGLDYVAKFAGMSRTKRVVTMWPRFLPFWETLVPKGKLVAIAAPPIDQEQFCPQGPSYQFHPDDKGKFNVLVADSWREIDPWEMMHGLLLAADRIPGLRIHTFASETPLGAWEYLFRAMIAKGVKGALAGRFPDMDRVYRAMDLVATPHVIATRIVGEALSCGTALLAARGNDFAQFTCDPGDAHDVAGALVRAWESWRRFGRGLDGLVAEAAKAFSPETFARAMGGVYAEALL